LTNQQNPSSEFLPEIRRARIYQLTVFDVTDSELEILERGTPDSLYLNFSIFLLSSAISFTVALFTATVSNANIFTTIVVFTVVGYIGGIFLLLLWKKSHTSVTKCIENIRKRLPPEGIQQPLENADATNIEQT
jgi:hypothetical protein